MSFVSDAVPSSVVTAIAQSLQQPFFIPLQPGDAIYSLPAEDSTDFGDSPMVVTYGRSPGLSAEDTFAILGEKVRRARKRDDASNGEYSRLRGQALTGSTSFWSGARDEADDKGDPIPSSETGYKLILTVCDEPVGYCSFRISMDQYFAEPLDFQIEVFEIFIAPKYRQQRLSRYFAKVIVQLTLNALYELGERMTKLGVDDSYGLWLRIAADVYSRSGERFLETIEQEFESRQDQANSLEAEETKFILSPDEWCSEGYLPLFIYGYLVDPRW